jgi:hypothetical protein
MTLVFWLLLVLAVVPCATGAWALMNGQRRRRALWLGCGGLAATSLLLTGLWILAFNGYIEDAGEKGATTWPAAAPLIAGALYWLYRVFRAGTRPE